MTEDWHTDMEKSLIKQFGGEPTETFGADGTISGEPVEVRLAKKEDRFRLNQDTHETLLAEGGTYIFDDVQDNQPPRQIEADEIDDRLGEDWHSDRGYMHQFIEVDNLF